jgi:hypothetical protein
MKAKSTSNNLNINERLIRTLNEGFTGIQDVLKEIGTNVKALKEDGRNRSSLLAAPTKDSETQYAEDVHLIEQLLAHDRLQFVAVEESTTDLPSIRLDIETSLKEGNEVVHHGLEVCIKPDNMVIYPHKNLSPVCLKVDTQGKAERSNPSLVKIIDLIKEAVPQDELNKEQIEVFNSFFKSEKAIMRDD